MKTAVHKPYKAGRFKANNINHLLNKIYFSDGHFEDGSEPLKGLIWSISKYVKKGHYWVNTNLVEDCFYEDIPEDGLYPLVINPEYDPNAKEDEPQAFLGQILIQDGRINIDYLNNEIPEDYKDTVPHYFIEFLIGFHLRMEINFPME